MDSTVIDDMVKSGALSTLDTDRIEAFVAGPGLRALLFCGSHTHKRETHDVAVALRELLKDYAGELQAGVVAGVEDKDLQSRFRVLVSPSLVLVLGGEVLEVLPGVRDWADYTASLQRYLGGPRKRTAMAQQE